MIDVSCTPDWIKTIGPQVCHSLKTVMVTRYVRRVSQRLFLTRVETMEFVICIITQIVYAIVTFKLINSSFSSAYIVHISTPTGFKC